MAFPDDAPTPRQAPPPPAQPGGTLSWAMGLLVFVPIPFLGPLVAAIVMLSVYKSVAAKSPLARANARSAANWGVTFFLVSTICLAAHIILLFTFAGGEGVTDFYPLGIAITLYAAIWLLHVVLTITGTIRASQSKPMNVPFAIPFIRA